MRNILIFLIFFTNIALSKEFTSPPSIALRTEISFVSHMTLDSKTHIDSDIWMLNFTLINNIHNTSLNKVSIQISNKIAQSLEIDMDYIIAYQTHRKTKIQGIKKYIPNSNGAKLIVVDGANPAIFRYNKKLINQLKKYPKHAKSDPNTFIDNIIKGISEHDPKIKEFFLRELINWVELHPNLTKQNYKQLSQALSSNTMTDGMLSAFLGSRSSFYKKIGTRLLKNKAIDILKYYPINLNPLSNQPELIFQALTFIESNNIGCWNLYSRWTISNIPSITEKALLNLDKINSLKTIELAKTIILNTHLNDSTRRVLKRYITSNNILMKK